MDHKHEWKDWRVEAGWFGECRTCHEKRRTLEEEGFPSDEVWDLM